ncbi:hypothetical protein G5C60_49280 [Streptomyces sp. HC44]|uniref:Uncharacterized protein n=1 Tax=Streptomyces scabichelini TaxID=2711217 RepID=A0A6G4VML5_9ACTN|nr:hypothetical protein [Streptomyces scabichelini]NGO15369.1 hypothetical protein [Streptomyces scabichelini]
MQQYGLTPYHESESYEQELEFGAEAQVPGEYEIQGAEAEFGAHGEQPEYAGPGEAGMFGGHGEAGEFGAHAENWEAGAGLHEGPQYGETGQAELESPLSEQEEIQLASELLEITTEAELEQFLGGLLARIGRGVGGFLKSGVGRAIGGALKNVARFALPLAGKALGTLIPIPGLGTMVGGALGTMASKLFEVQSEGVDRQEYEFEVARRFVRLAATAANNAALDQRQGAPQLLARDALLSAARRHAPGLVRYPQLVGRPAPWYWPAQPPAASMNGAGQPGLDADRPQSGRWVRHGRKIVILGL